MSDFINEELNEEIGEEVNENLIELTDEETGEKILFELLDTIIVDGNEYYALTEFVEEPEEESDVYIMMPVDGEDGEQVLEIVEEEEIIEKVFAIFQENNADDFEFSEE